MDSFQHTQSAWTPTKHNNRSDHIDYSEHLLRKTVQRNALRSSQKNLPPTVENDLLEHRKNLPLYLHRLTAELKRKKGNTKNIRELFTSYNPDQPIVVLPNLATNRPPPKSEIEKEFKLPNDPLTRKIFEDLTHTEPIDFFVIETPAAEEKKKNERVLRKPQQTVEEKIRTIIRGKLEEEMYDKLDICYKEYTKIRIAEKLRQLTFQESQVSRNQQSKKSKANKQSVLSYNNPRVVQFFTTQTFEDAPNQEAQVEEIGYPQAEIKTKAKEEEEQDEKLIEDICKKESVKVCEFFNIEENEFNRKYQNQFLEEFHKGGSLASPSWSLSALVSPKTEKIRMFDEMDIDDHERHTKLYGKKLFVNDEIARRRERDFLFDKYTIARGVRLNKKLEPEKNSKRRRQVIMQTKYRQDPLAEDPQDKIRIEKVTISTGEDAKLIKNTEKLMELFPKSAKKLNSPLNPTSWWMEAIGKIDTAEEQLTEKITIEDDEKQVINKIFKAGTFHSRAQSDRLGTTASTFSDMSKSVKPTPTTTTDKKAVNVRIPTIMNFAKIKQNRQETKEIRSIFSDFYEDLTDFTAVSKEETEDIDLKIMDAATEVDLEYFKIQSVHDQEIIKNLAKDFTNLQKKNRFKHKLVNILTNKITDKKGLLEEYDKLQKEEKLKQRINKNLQRAT